MGCRGAGVGFSLLISRRARLSTLKVRNTRANRPPIAAAAAATARAAPARTGGACARAWRRGTGADAARYPVVATAAGKRQTTRKPHRTQTNTTDQPSPCFISQPPGGVFSSPSEAGPLRGPSPARRCGEGRQFALAVRVTGARGERPPQRRWEPRPRESRRGMASRRRPGPGFPFQPGLPAEPLDASCNCRRSIHQRGDTRWRFGTQGSAVQAATIGARPVAAAATAALRFGCNRQGRPVARMRGLSMITTLLVPFSFFFHIVASTGTVSPCDITCPAECSSTGRYRVIE